MGRGILFAACGLLIATLAPPAAAAPRIRAHGARAAPKKRADAKPRLRRTSPVSVAIVPSAAPSADAAPASSASSSPSSASTPPSSSGGIEAGLGPLDGAAPRDAASPAAPPPRRRVTVGINPLPMIAGRYGLDVQLVPLRHHALVASAWLQTFTPAMLRVLMPREVDVSRGADARLGGELGYRFYTGADGAHGLFAGISGVAMPIVYPRVGPGLKTEVLSFYAYGGAIDVGVQAIVASGFTLGGGLGAMYLAYTPPSSIAPPPGVAAPKVPELHVLPRLLLTAGWSL